MAAQALPYLCPSFRLYCLSMSHFSYRAIAHPDHFPSNYVPAFVLPALRLPFVRLAFVQAALCLLSVRPAIVKVAPC
jgi:hypothetical protein